MGALYAFGHEQAKAGRAWHKAPPTLEVPASTAVR